MTDLAPYPGWAPFLLLLVAYFLYLPAEVFLRTEVPWAWAWIFPTVTAARLIGACPYISLALCCLVTLFSAEVDRLAERERFCFGGKALTSGWVIIYYCYMSACCWSSNSWSYSSLSWFKYSSFKSGICYWSGTKKLVSSGWIVDAAFFAFFECLRFD